MHAGINGVELKCCCCGIEGTSKVAVTVAPSDNVTLQAAKGTVGCNGKCAIQFVVVAISGALAVPATQQVVNKYCAVAIINNQNLVLVTVGYYRTRTIAIAVGLCKVETLNSALRVEHNNGTLGRCAETILVLDSIVSKGVDTALGYIYATAYGYLTGYILAVHGR